MDQNSTGESDEVITSIKLSRSDHDALKAIAAQQHRSMSGQIRYWIDGHRDDDDRAAA